jgi:2-polyprenyl-3-methyl-5-hydroxy-6-metoxy-1,4-benzoquinol methylase
VNRPFYTKYAWAYDLLIHRPVTEHIEFIKSRLHYWQVPPSACFLDAGCGTGTYSIALAKEGFSVTGIDSSADLIAEAKRKTGHAEVHINFVIGDILALPVDSQFDAILCRGVLNDLTSMDARRMVFSSFAKAMRKGGILMFDVREWQSTLVRKTSNPVTEKIVQTERGKLLFRSITSLEPETHSMLISETHELQCADGRETNTFDFIMRCWTQEELGAYLSSAGFDHFEYYSDYNVEMPIGSTDRLVVVARLEKKVY